MTQDSQGTSVAEPPGSSSFEPRSRVFEFPTEIDTDDVRTTLENGLLRIRVPKAVAGRWKVIRVGQ